MPVSSKRLAGPGYIILNVLRGLNIISLILVACASFIMLVKTVISSQFFFFDGLSHIVCGSIAIFLTVSELNLFKSYFARQWPLLSPQHGLVALALSMCSLGINTLGNLNKTATSQKNLGLGFWRIVISSGILVMLLSFFNLIANYVFRDRDLGVTARQIRAKGAVAITEAEEQLPGSASYVSRSNTGNSSQKPTMDQHVEPVIDTGTPPAYMSEKRQSRRSTRFGIPIRPNFFSRSEHPRPSSSHYSSPDPERAAANDNNNENTRKMNISSPLNINPQFAHFVRRPDSAYHPSNNAGMI